MDRYKWNDSGTISKSSNGHNGQGGFRSLASTKSTSNAGVETVSSFSKFLAIAQNFTPSVLTNVWSKQTASDNSTANGTDFEFGTIGGITNDKIPSHDDYLSNDEDNEEDRKGSSTTPTSKLNFDTRRVVAPDGATKRSHDHFSDIGAAFEITKRRKLTAETEETPSRRKLSATLTKRISQSRSRRFWTSIESSRPTSSVIPSHSPSAAGSLIASRSSSRASLRGNETAVNLFSIPAIPSSTHRYRGLTPSRPSSTLSGSRPSSVTSYTAGTTADRNVVGFNSETRRILRDLERAAGMPLAGVHPASLFIKRPASGLGVAGRQDSSGGVPTTSGGLSEDAHTLPRLAAMGTRTLRMPLKNHTLDGGVPNGERKQVGSTVGAPSSWTNPSRPVFQFGKPLSIVSEESSGKGTPSGFRFGVSDTTATRPAFAAAASTTAQTGSTTTIGNSRICVPSSVTRSRTDRSNAHRMWTYSLCGMSIQSD